LKSFSTRRRQVTNDKKGKESKTPVKPGQTDGSILPAMVKAYGGPFWFSGLLQIALNCLTFASPLLLNQLITYTSQPLESAPLWQGLVLVFSLFLVTFLSSLLNGQYFLKTFVVGFRIRSGLISAIYRKSLRISSAAKKDTTVGEIVNLMAVDAQRFFELISYLVRFYIFNFRHIILMLILSTFFGRDPS
jgi:ATP-binding cassette, subfamily C (CFTR/MRP), member 1